ncbi:MAG TPA: PDZ domain-containing protein [Pyrinomonadaceae bacterium]|nr:PDZ domain-containing protein [Pyrinomonadaceae bacterium]
MKYLVKPFSCLALSLCFILSLCATAAHAQQRASARVERPVLATPVTVAVDASEATRGLFHARLTIPVKQGPLTLYYPKWIPGEHGPTGPIVQLAGLRFSAAGRAIAWQRDAVDMYALHCTIPAGVKSLEVSLDYLSPATAFAGSGYGFTPNATPHVAVVLWNQLLLYPQGRPADAISYRASLRLPRGWKYGTALPVSREDGETINFDTVSLTTLIDSPVIAGENFRSLMLEQDQDSSVEIDIAADSATDLSMSDELVERYKRMVAEALALYGAHHYRHYHFLLSLSDAFVINGLEHHESSDNRAPETMFTNSPAFLRYSTLLPHEFTHSWNGKYRRPAGLATPDYQQPMRGELLWVYEGLTQYLGNFLLTSRSGLRSVEDSLDYIAYVAANLDTHRGREWRPLVDTATGAQILYGAPDDWAAWRRGAEYYDEGALIWLEADTIIRERSNGRRSLDDFCRAFHGGQSGAPRVLPYTFDDVVAALNQVSPYDWRAFLTSRVYNINPHPPMGGIERSGWKLVFTDVPNAYVHVRELTTKTLNMSFSLGLWLKEDGTVMDVMPGSVADRIGMTPGAKIVSVNGQSWSAEAMRGAVKATKNSAAPLQLVVETGGQQVAFQLNYHDGDRYPHLVRDAARPDLLAQILKPLT